jgi:hypothetical protein
VQASRVACELCGMNWSLLLGQLIEKFVVEPRNLNFSVEEIRRILK